MKRIVIVIGILIIIAILVYGIITGSRKISNGSEHNLRLSIVTSFYPLYFFTTQIAGEYATVYNITPAGAEPHDYEPTIGDIALLEKSDLIILNGGNLEPWAENIKKNIKDSTKIIITGDNLMDITKEEDGQIHQDPHVWLNPQLAQKQVENISLVLQQIDTKHKESYQRNASILIQKLDTLDQEFHDNLRNCTKRTIVTSHDAYGYIVRAYNLQQQSISGISPDEEPSPKKLSEITDFVKSNNVKYIFFETLLSPKYAKTIAQEAGAQTLVFNPLEGLTTEEQNQGEDYFSIQRENLANLKTALECK